MEKKNKNIMKEEKIKRKREKVNRRENRKKLLLRPWGDALPSLAMSKIIRNLSFRNRFRSIPFVCKAWRSLFWVYSISYRWDALPSLALLNIFRNLNYRDRFGSIPLVCKEWNYIISNDYRCWSSMIPDSISPDEAFIKKPDYPFQVDSERSRRRQKILRDPGVSYLRKFIKKSSCSSGSGSSTITSLCLDPFHFYNSWGIISDDLIHQDFSNYGSIHQDEVLHLIACCCPNLKHISFDGFYGASRKAVLEVFHSCTKIELIDFSDSRYADSVQVIEELGKCLPNLRGIRIAGWPKGYHSIDDAIATHLPRIKLLALDYRSSRDYDFWKLTSETQCCLSELQYLSIGLWEIKQPVPVCTHIPEFHYEKLLGCKCQYNGYDFQPQRSVHQSKFRHRSKLECHRCLFMKELYKEHAKANEEAYWESCEKYFRFDDEDYSIMKQKKEYEYYVSISKEQKKKTRRNHPYVVLRTRMRKNKEEASFISKMKMRKKRDKYDYQDYYVQPLL